MAPRLHIRTLLCIGLLIPGLLITSRAAANGVEQESCPVMPEERIDPEYFTDHQGERVYFCCARCRGRFERNPEQYAANLKHYVPAFSGSPVAHTETHLHDSIHEGAALTHDHHDHDHGERSRLLAWLGKHHPFVVHFPIAFLIVSACVELVRLHRDRPRLADIARFCIWVGAIGAVIAAVLGWFFGGFRIVDDDRVMTAHRWLGTAVAVSALVTLFFCERQGERGAAYRTTLFVTAMLVAVTGFLGGSLIYGIDHLKW